MQFGPAQYPGGMPSIVAIRDAPAVGTGRANDVADGRVDVGLPTSPLPESRGWIDVCAPEDEFEITSDGDRWAVPVAAVAGRAEAPDEEGRPGTNAPRSIKTAKNAAAAAIGGAIETAVLTLATMRI